MKSAVLVVGFQNLDSEKEKELERQARIEASLREREREVQKARSEQTKEIDREREQHKREEAIQNFKALLSDMVRHWQLLRAGFSCWVLPVKAFWHLEFSSKEVQYLTRGSAILGSEGCAFRALMQRGLSRLETGLWQHCRAPGVSGWSLRLPFPVLWWTQSVRDRAGRRGGCLDFLVLRVLSWVRGTSLVCSEPMQREFWCCLFSVVRNLLQSLLKSWEFIFYFNLNFKQDKKISI